MPIETLQIIIYALIAITIILAAFILILNLRIKRLMRGKKANSLEDTILALENEIRIQKKAQKNTDDILKKFNKRISKSICSAQNINYKAFGGMDSGGDNSFSTALVDENGNGIILSTLHARNRINVYLKNVENWNPDREITEEEALALKKVKDSCSM